MHACSWESLCKPKEAGRLGIWRVQDLRTAAGLKLFWRCFTTDSIWVSWMKKVYARHNSPWEAHSHPMASGTWKFLSCRGLALLHLTVEAGIDSSDSSEISDTWNRRVFFYSAWDVARTPSPLYTLSSLVWRQFTCPKMSCGLLRAQNDRLLMRARLLQFQVISQDNCVLCTSGSETIDHLFLDCSFSAYIWAQCKLKLEPPKKLDHYRLRQSSF